MKAITIKIVVNEDEQKIATAYKLEGYRKDNISDQLEILGHFENLKNQQLKVLSELGRFVKEGR